MTHYADRNNPVRLRKTDDVGDTYKWRAVL